MLEALVRKSDNVIVLVRQPGLPWGIKEGRIESSPFYVIELNDPDLEKHCRNGRVLSYPYAGWRSNKYKEIDVDLGEIEVEEYRMVNAGHFRVPVSVAGAAKNRLRFDKSGRLVACSRIDKRRLAEVALEKPEDVVSHRPPPVKRVKSKPMEGIEDARTV